MSDFKFGIAKREFRYNHLRYIVEVKEDHSVWWEVRMLAIAGAGDGLTSDFQYAHDVDASPAGAIIWAHESARAWIDNYVETHLILQDAVEAAQSKYGDN